MQSNLAKQLIAKGAIRQGTVFEAHYDAFGLSCVNNNRIISEFILLSAKIKKDQVLFDSIGEGDVKRCIPVSDIVKVDGMEIDRMAGIYSLDMNGNEVTVSAKRRGRKPKLRDSECECLLEKN